MRYLLLAAYMISMTATVMADDEVTLIPAKQSLKAMVGDDVFTVFQFSKDRNKPFFLPVTGPGGMGLLAHATPNADSVAGRKVIVCSENAELKSDDNSARTVALNEILEVGKIDGDMLWIEDKHAWIHRRDVAPLASTVTRIINDNPEKIKDRKSPLYYDHPHHKGVWNSVDEVNEIKFWNEDGRIENHSIEVIKTKGNPAVFQIKNHWLNKEGAPMVLESTTVSLYANRLMAVDITFSSVSGEVTFDDTKEGMFAIRLPNSMREMVAGGPVINADGDEGTKACWGKTSRWIDYCGPIDGQVFGVTLMDHPENPRPSRYHVRDYGLFAINPFGVKAYTSGKEPAEPLTLAPAESVRFRFGLYVHDGQIPTDKIQEVYNQFTAAK